MDKNATVLFRGFTPGAFGIDVHGGYGETWSRDFEVAKGYAHPPNGFVFEAILPASAKQLILVTERDDEGFSEYVEEGIKTLAEIVDDPWLYDSVMSGRKMLWEIWEPECTEALMKAGYDSIFTGGFDGPEEYVLNRSLLQFTRYYRILAHNSVKEYPIKTDTLVQLGYVS